jgi:hypothetical protein
MKKKICLVTIVLLSCLVALGAPLGQNSRYDVTGRWRGKFPLPDDSNLSDDENPVAVEVFVKDDAGRISGTTVFYVIRTKDNKPQVVGKTEAELVDPQFDGTTLKFHVKSKGLQPGKETSVEMQMKLISANEAELANLEDTSSPVFKMKKIP